MLVKDQQSLFVDTIYPVDFPAKLWNLSAVNVAVGSPRGLNLFYAEIDLLRAKILRVFSSRALF